MSSEAAKRATAKYQRDKMESISIRVKRTEGLYDRIKQAAAAEGIKPAQFIKSAIEARINGNTAPTETAQRVQAQPQQPLPEGAVIVQLDAPLIHNMDGAISHGYGVNRQQYIVQALDAQLKRDMDTERAKRRQRATDQYFFQMDMDIEADNRQYSDGE